MGKLGGALFVFLVVAALVVKEVLTAQELGNLTSPILGIVFAAVLAGLVLWSWPVPRLTRPAPRVVLGVVLIQLGYLVIVAAYAVYGYVFVISGNDWTFNRILAGTAVAVFAGGLVIKAGISTAGSQVKWPWQSIAEQSMYLMAKTDAVAAVLFGVAARAALFGYTPFFAQLAWFLISWLPIHLYRLLLAWWHVPWVALTVDILLFPVWLFVFNLVGLGVNLVLSLVFRWAGAPRLSIKHALPVWVWRGPGGRELRIRVWKLAYAFPLEARPPEKSRAEQQAAEERDRRFTGMRALERPLTQAERGYVRHNVGRAAAAIVEARIPDWRTITIGYRAAGSHEEVTIETGYEEKGVRGSLRTEERLVPDFPEVKTLRRLREAAYEAGEGTSFAWRLRASRGTRGYGIRRWTDMLGPWEPVPGEPDWHEPPTLADYRADLARFPRRELPDWLRTKGV